MLTVELKKRNLSGSPKRKELFHRLLELMMMMMMMTMMMRFHIIDARGFALGFKSNRMTVLGAKQYKKFCFVTKKFYFKLPYRKLDNL